MDAGEDSFGPVPNIFDFTLLFEQSLLSILPNAIFLLLASYRLGQLWRQSACNASRKHLLAKLSTAGALASLQTAASVLWSLLAAGKVRTTIAAGILRILEGIGIFFLSYFEHTRAISQSMCLNIYLLVTSLLDIVPVRTVWIRSNEPALASVLSIAFAFRILLLILEECPKTAQSTEKAQCRETRAGFISRSVFWWLNGFFITGYRRALEVADIGFIGIKFDSESLREQLERTWDADDKKGNWTLIKCTFMAYKGQFAAGIPPRIFYSGFTFAQPFLINSMVAYIAQDGERSQQEGAGLIGATVLVYTGLAISSAWYRHATFQLLTMYRGGLVALVFKKTLDLESSGVGDMAPVTLMSTDVEGIALGGASIHDIWAALIELPVAIFLLYRQVGIPSLFILIPAILTTISASIIAPKLGPAKVLWNSAIQERVSDTSGMLEQVKSVKMMGYTDFLLRRLRTTRAHEVDLSVKFRWYQASLHGLSTASAAITPVIVILAAIFWTKSGEGLSVANAFTSLSIVTIASAPIVNILVSMMQLFSVVGCFARLQSFLLLGTHRDPRSFSGLSSAPSSRPGSSISEYIEKVHPSNSEPTDTEYVIKFSDATFGIGDKCGLLRNVSLELRRGSLSMVVGRVGCGKSLLLKAAIGELPLQSGTLKSNVQCAAYCDQAPWILNTSVEENVIGQTKYDEEWFRTVTFSCGLDEDLATFSHGQRTLVGSGGLALSGGQKQRIGLARAAYSREEFLVFDDVFSGLDNKTAKLVFNRLLGKDGILRNNKQTVILVTNNEKLLPAADYITMLENGSIVRNQVSYDAFEPSDWGVGADAAKGKSACNAHNTQNAVLAGVKSEGPFGNPQIASEHTVTKVENDLSRQTGDMDCYKIYLKSLGFVVVLTTIALVILSAGAEKLPQIWLRLWTERGTNTNKLAYMGGYVAFGVAAAVGQFAVIAYFLVAGVPRSANRLHSMLLRSVLGAPLHFFTSTDNGVTLNRFSQDMSLIDQTLPVAFAAFIILVVQAVAEVAIIASGASYVGVIIPIGIIMVYFIQRYYLRTSRQLRFMDLELKSPLYTQFTETVAGLATIRAYGWAGSAKIANNRRLNTSQQPYYIMFCIQRWLQIVLDLFSAGMAVMLVVFAVLLPRTTSGGAIGLALVNVISFNLTLSSVIMVWTQLETSIGAIARLKWFTELTPNENKPQETAEVSIDWPSQGRIELDNVVAAYRDEGEAILKGISLTIEPGTKVGVCGRSGSGKSSLIATLARLLELQGSGTMRLDGIDLATIPRQTIRSRMLALPQDGFILPGTVKFNLDPEGKIASDGKLVDALTKTGIWALVEPRGGLSAKLEDLSLSAGQLQLFCLSRVIVRCSGVSGGILLLDEATSNLDMRTDDEVRSAIAGDLDEKTVVEVAHRLEIVRNYDVIVVMAEGRIVETGEPDELLATPDSEFLDLWNSRSL